MESVTSKSLRPHMQRRDGETIEQWHYWLTHSTRNYRRWIVLWLSIRPRSSC